MNNDYDIFDDKKFEQEFFDPAKEQNDKYMFNKYQIELIKNLRQDAKKVIKIQDNGWDRNGDSYASQDLRNFVVKNKKEIMGIFKDLKWINYGKNWQSHIDYYYYIAQVLIIRSQYAITNYKKANKKILIRIKQRR